MDTQETDIYYTFLTGLSALTLLFLVSFYSIIRHQRRKREWLRELAKRDQMLLENERERIASDLHDDFGSVLSSISLGLDLINEKYPDDTLIPATKKHLQQSLVKLKEISHNLVPQLLKLKGFCAAMVALAESINIDGKHRLVFEGECQDIGFNDQQALLLYRVLQEIITNALKHSGATLIRVTMKQENRHVFLSVYDNGKGFFYERAINSPKSFGLQNIRSRLHVLNASCKVETLHHSGTLYEISIPIVNLQTASK